MCTGSHWKPKSFLVELAGGFEILDTEGDEVDSGFQEIPYEIEAGKKRK